MSCVLCPVGQLPLSSVSTRIFKSFEKGVQFNPTPRTESMEKGVFVKESKKFSKRGFLGPTHLIKNNIYLVSGKDGGGG